MTMRFDGCVAVVTGAGGGLGRQHALALAARGAKVVVNDLGGTLDGNGATPSAALAVVEEIRRAGGQAIASGASVTDAAAVQAMVDDAMKEWGRIDILVNNAGILRDKSFTKMTLDDLPPRGRSAPDGRGELQQGGVGHHARAKLRPHRDDDLVERPVRQLRAVELRRREDGAGRPDADALDRRGEEQHPRQLPGADRSHADDRKPDARSGAQAAAARDGDAGAAGAGG